MKKLVFGTVVAVVMGISSVVVAQDKKWFAGPTLGSTWTQGSNLGLNGGYKVNKYFAVEANYDHVFNSSASIDLVTSNAVLGYKVPGVKLTPYILAGGGYQWLSGSNQGVWNVGGGTKIELTSTVDMDVRYRYVQGVYNNQQNENVVTVGTVFKF